MVKPNVSELFAMTKLMLEKEVIRTTTVANIVSAYYNQPGDTKKWTYSDVRGLACSLLTAMNTIPGRGVHVIAPSTKPYVTGKHVIVSMGDMGVLWVGPSNVLGSVADTEVDDYISYKHIPAESIPCSEIVNTSGAGDSFCAGFINSVLLNGGERATTGVGGPTVDDIIAGVRYAGRAIRSSSTVPVNVSHTST